MEMAPLLQLKHFAIQEIKPWHNMEWIKYLKY